MTQETQQNEQAAKHPEKKSFALVRLGRYFRDSIAEFKKVVWPKRADAIKTTTFVIAFVAVFVIFIYGVDTITSYLLNTVLLRG